MSQFSNLKSEEMKNVNGGCIEYPPFLTVGDTTGTTVKKPIKPWTKPNGEPIWICH